MSKPKPTPKTSDKRRHFDAAFKLPSSQFVITTMLTPWIDERSETSEGLFAHRRRRGVGDFESSSEYHHRKITSAMTINSSLSCTEAAKD